MHDATVDRMTDGKGKISELTYKQLRQLKIHSNTADAAKTYKIPTFTQVLELCRHKINIYLDFKDADVLQSYRMIKKYQVEKEVIVYINSASQYTAWKKIAPYVPLIVSLPDSIKTAAAVKAFITMFPVAVLDGNYKEYTNEMVAAAQAAGVCIWPDIQGKDEDVNWGNALALGFTGLQTDHPAALIAWLKKNERISNLDTVTINRIQVIGSYNSYKQAIDPALFTFLQKQDSAGLSFIDCSHISLTEQLNMGLLNLEIDVYADSACGKYAHPKGLDWVTGQAHYDSEEVMREPGVKVFHVPNGNYGRSDQLIMFPIDHDCYWSSIPIVIIE